MKIKLLCLFLLITINSTSQANETADEIAQLRQQILLLSERLDKLEAKSAITTSKDTVTLNTTEKHKPTADPKPATNELISKLASDSWFNRVTYKADIRNRYEYIDQRGREVRNRNRLRLRAAFKMQVNDTLDFSFGLASGDDNPNSTNQSFDNAFSTKDIRLDLAYFNWQLNDEFTLTGGKMKNPFYRPARNPILWDNDLNPEGLALSFDNNFIQASIVGYAVEERKAADDTSLFGGQLMHEFTISATSKLRAGVGYYDYQNLKGNSPIYNGRNLGNSLDTDGNIANDFNTAEVFLEYKTKLLDRPLSIYGNYYQNTAVTDLDSAYAFGFMYGKVKDTGSWSFGYAYLDIEADAVFALFNDSDFAGGNTDSTGYIIRAAYGLKSNMSLGLVYIDSEIGQSQTQQIDYDRLQLDFGIKFK